MKIYKADASTVMESDDESWQNILESKRLLAEVLKFCTVVKKSPPAAAAAAASSTNNKRKGKIKKEIDAFDHLDVTSLRE